MDRINEETRSLGTIGLEDNRQGVSHSQSYGSTLTERKRHALQLFKRGFGQQLSAEIVEQLVTRFEPEQTLPALERAATAGRLTQYGSDGTLLMFVRARALSALALN